MEDLTGKQFGLYQIVTPLGEGGMAAVYKAYQPSMERYVAVKVLARQLAESEEFVARFKGEAHMLAQLQHPHILPVFDYGQSEGYSYIVMPFLHSGTLADLMKTRRLSLLDIRRIVSQIGDALGFAHARGMVHRDVKPGNVLLDERENCLLTDFGLARMIRDSSRITSAGTIMGTPAYLSPEQATDAELDGRSDLYSLGIILYEMVTGQVPYSARTPLAVVFKHVNEPLPSARALAPELSDALEQVLVKTLAKDPADRYQTAESFVRALQQAIPTDPNAKPTSRALDSVFDRLMAKDGAAKAASAPVDDKTRIAPPPDDKTVISNAPMPPSEPDSQQTILAKKSPPGDQQQ